MADHARGNELFRCGDFSAAAQAYTAGLRGAYDAGARSTLFSNRAACRLSLGAGAEAEADCRAGLALSPLEPKLHYRLAQALVAQGEAASAAEPVAAAVALVGSAPLGDELRRLYQQVAEAAAAAAAAEDRKPGAVLLQLPEDARDVVLAGSAPDLAYHVAAGVPLVVLRPGSYLLPMSLAARAPRCTVLGLGAAGSAQLTCRVSHAVFVEYGDVTLVNLRLAGDGERAAACVAPRGAGASSPVLRMLRCSVEDYAGGGVLLHGGAAQLERCSLRRCGKMGVEVRQGGSLEARGVHVEQCMQGVSAYGGARSVELHDCSVLRCQKEGIMASGSQESAAGAAQAALLPSQAPNNQATLEAEAWGKAARLDLRLVVEGGEVSHNGSFGMSIDNGCTARIAACRLHFNDPYSVFIKGGSDVSITACQLAYGSGRSGASHWAKLNNRAKLELAGITVAVNYGGDVQVVGCAFSGPQDRAVYSELQAQSKRILSDARLMGMWTKPPVSAAISHHATAEQLPGVDELATRLPGATRLGRARQQPAPPPTTALRRPGLTFPQPSWAPTASQYYVIGNTHGFNVAAGLPAACTRARVLLAGCGDIRNLVATVAAAVAAAGGAGHDAGPESAGSGAQQHQPEFDFVLNDGSISMLARDSVLLHMAAQQDVPPEAVLAGWASHGLSGEHAGALLRSCRALADEPWPAWLAASTSLAGGQAGSDAQHAAEELVREACRAWAQSGTQLDELLQLREALSGGQQARDAAEALSLSTIAVGGAPVQRHRKEVAAYLRTGSLPAATKQQQPSRANPTFLLAPQLQYTAYFSSSIYRAVALAPASSSQQSAAQRLAAAALPQIVATGAALRGGRLHLLLVPGDILEAATAGGEAIEPFDFIDTSNVSDYTSLPALLQACAPLLAATPHARLRLESFIAYRLSQPQGVAKQQPTAQQFVEGCLGMPASTSELLLGLRLLGGQLLPDVQQPALRMEWAASAAPPPGSEAADAAAGGPAKAPAAVTTGTGMYLALKPAFNKFVATFAAPSKAGAPKDWCSHGSPASFAHLLALAAPTQSQAAQLLELLLRGSAGGAAAWAALFSQELQLHAAIQAGGAPEVRRLRYAASTGYRLLGHQQHPLLLALSGAPLPCGAPGLKPAALNHLVSAFSWDEHAGDAWFLLPAAAAGGGFVTLCVLSEAGLGAVGVSQPLAKLERAEVAVRPWRALQPWLRPSQLDLRLVELAVAAPAGAGRGSGGGWQSAVASCAELIVVDILAPGAIPAAAEVATAVAGGVLVVTVAGGAGPAGPGATERGGASGWWGSAGRFSVDLPGGEGQGPVATKLSRALGLLSCRVRRAAAG